MVEGLGQSLNDLVKQCCTSESADRKQTCDSKESHEDTGGKEALQEGGESGQTNALVPA